MPGKYYTLRQHSFKKGKTLNKDNKIIQRDDLKEWRGKAQREVYQQALDLVPNHQHPQ